MGMIQNAVNSVVNSVASASTNIQHAQAEQEQKASTELKKAMETKSLENEERISKREVALAQSGMASAGIAAKDAKKAFSDYEARYNAASEMGQRRMGKKLEQLRYDRNKAMHASARAQMQYLQAKGTQDTLRAKLAMIRGER